ncbi:P-loop containing nucleoside triphosphate hydrolase protein [Pyrenochaeta sp. DS3sAY3a]|nr:P-loop containing nucleoside triphosphate hydrolase protein [Pyrenochaeta sp. DS3sAY3a]
MVQQSDVLIAVIGVTGAGKTTFVSKATGRKDLEIGSDLSSCTQEVQIAETVIGGRRVILIDTPGFDDSDRTEADILRLIANYLAEMYQDGKRLNGVILLQPISINRIMGSEWKRTRLFERVCGPDAYGNIVIATTMWSDIKDTAVGLKRMKERMQEDSLWGPMVKKGACVVKHDNSPSSAREIVEILVNKSKVTLQMQEELVNNGGRIGQTSAGKQLNADLREACARYEREIEELRKECSHFAEDMQDLREKVERVNKEKEELERSQVSDFSCCGWVVSTKLLKVDIFAVIGNLLPVLIITGEVVAKASGCAVM